MKSKLLLSFLLMVAIAPLTMLGQKHTTAAKQQTSEVLYDRCLAPTDVQVAYTSTGATVSWESMNNNFDVRYLTFAEANPMLLQYGFENGTLEGWTTIDADGDGYTWLPNTTFGGHDDSEGVVNSASYDNIVGVLSPDNYLISPQIALGGSISFWACAQDALWASEHFGVAVSTTNNTSPSAFTTVEEWTMSAKGSGAPTNHTRSGSRAQGNWYQYTVDLSAYEGQMGYVAIRHFNSTNWFSIDVDDITIAMPGDQLNWNTINGITGTSCELTDLLTETKYVVQVRSNCSGGGHSNWTAPTIFVTHLCQLEDMCQIIYELYDSYGDGWTGCNISVVDVETEAVITTLTLPSGSYGTGSFAVCDGRDINFVWGNGSYPGDVSYTFYNVEDEEIFSGSGTFDNPVSYTVNCPFCPTPTRMTVTPLYNSATVTWRGFNELYELDYRTATVYTPIFSDGFESGNLNNWTLIDNGNPTGHGWHYLNIPNLGWDTQPSAHGGVGVASSWSWDNYPVNQDSYMISPLVEGADLIRYYVATNVSYPDTYSIMVSSTGTELNDFTTVFTEAAPAEKKEGGHGLKAASSGGNRSDATVSPWTERVIALPAGTKYVAFRHVDYDMNFLFIDDVTIYEETVPVGEWNSITATESSARITGLIPTTKYEYRIAGICDGVLGNYTQIANFTTTNEPCWAPTNMTASPMSNSASLTWTGTSDSYQLEYRRAATYVSKFWDSFSNSNLIPWTVIDNGDPAGYGWHFNNINMVLANLPIGHSGHGIASSWSYRAGVGSINQNSYMISPWVSDATSIRYFVAADTDFPETYSIMVSSTGYDIGSFTTVYTETVPTDAKEGHGVHSSNSSGDERALSAWMERNIPLPAGTKYVAFHHYGSNNNYLLIDDVTIYGEATPAGEWYSITCTEPNAELTGLAPNTDYEYRIAGICDGVMGVYTGIAKFSTFASKRFVTEGNWNEDANWEPAGAPSVDEDVVIDAPAIIPAGCVATAHDININGGSITIKDGGQLKHSTEELYVTIEKDISGYPDPEERSGYYFISYPLQYDSYATEVEGLLTNEYDFYVFSYNGSNNGASDPYPYREWRNYKAWPFFLYAGFAGLYANSEDVTLRFTGPTWYTNENYLVTSYFTGNYVDTVTYYNGSEPPTFKGWSLTNNPFVCDGYPVFHEIDGGVMEANFYTMNAAGDGYELSESSVALAPCEGAFMQCDETGRLYLYSYNPIDSYQRSGILNVNVTQGHSRVDQARIRFGKGHNLGKMSFFDKSMVYIPQDGEDCAVVYASNMGEVPVNFKALENDIFMLSFSMDEVSFDYLHLIDNMTGKDVDLLVNPSYTFEASTTDYASRFKLVFATGDNSSDDNFAFYSNGNFIINNEGEATLQVVDVTGRIIKSETINGSASVNVDAATGVYMLRLINGNDVKVQKVVVR